MICSERARSAVRGTVTDSLGEPVEGASVRVSQRGKDVTTTAGGEFWRLLVPGSYTFFAFKEDMESEEMDVVVTEGQTDGPTIDLILNKTSDLINSDRIQTSPSTTSDSNKEDGLKLTDPLGLVCIKVTWTGLRGCD